MFAKPPSRCGFELWVTTQDGQEHFLSKDFSKVSVEVYRAGIAHGDMRMMTYFLRTQWLQWYRPRYQGLKPIALHLVELCAPDQRHRHATLDLQNL